MKVAAVQMVSGLRMADNLAQAKALLLQAAAAGAELVVLPEYFSAMGLQDHDKLAMAENFGEGPVQAFLAEMARTLGLWIVGGTMPLACSSRDHVRNSSLVYSPTGECVARYDKIHLFRFDRGGEHYDEGSVIEAGEKPVQFSLQSRNGQVWCVGLSVCYDLRFPELYRLHSKAGAHLVLAPSAFTYITGQAHWELLLRARAIENQVYVLAPAQGGVHENGRHTWGHSMLVDPWGQVLAQKTHGAHVVLGDLDAAQLARVRLQMPVLAHRVLYQ